MMQFDWEPLSHSELDQRLDQAVEEIIEADLIEKVQGQCGPVILHVSQPEDPIPTTSEQTQTQVAFLLSGSPAPSTFVVHGSRERETQEQSNDAAEGNTVVQYVTELLQNSNSSYSQSRLAGRARLSLPHTVLLSLTLLSKRLSYRSVSSSFRLEKGNIHRIFFSFCERANALMDQQIRWPMGQEALEHLLPFSSWLGRNEDLEQRGLPRVLGVLGHTRIPIRLPISKQDAESHVLDAKRLKKEVHPDSWLNLELVCDGQGRFIHCRVSRGSEKDRASALLKKLQLCPEMMPPETCIVAMGGYPLTEHILTPFVSGRSTQENLYNRCVETHLGRFEQAVADLKERFQRLRYLDMGNYERAKAVVLTACILHNALLDTGDVVVGKAERETREEEGGAEEREAGRQRRDTVVQLLYSTLETATD
ncbi:uncharacterized protein LOC115826691 [Chanos chanos]|uniref:Uncharacterized protein LOC115826691 n=1 Tax=Chanos chanos TaxID=29144 RepID=A0A6J2WRL3_CHACN|nr:uncharacterized protein LOC115826691 [Chanos chanos]